MLAKKEGEEGRERERVSFETIFAKSTKFEIV